MARTATDDLLLGEWACLGALYSRPAHGFAVAARLKPTGDIGRIWSLSRPLTYRALDQLVQRGLLADQGQQPGLAGGNRTILKVSRLGRLTFRHWLNAPVVHLRDLRSELLLKLVLAEDCMVDISEMIDRQRNHLVDMEAALSTQLTTESVGVDRHDVVGLWRSEAAKSAIRFIDRLDR